MSRKQVTILLTSIILIFMFSMFYAIAMKTVSVAAIASRFQLNNTLTPADFTEIDSLFNKAIFVELGLFALLQILSFAMYMQKNKRMLNILLLIEVILTVIEIFAYSNPEYIIFALPAINTALYLYGLKDEDDKNEKAKSKTKKNSKTKKK